MTGIAKTLCSTAALATALLVASCGKPAPAADAPGPTVSVASAEAAAPAGATPAVERKTGGCPASRTTPKTGLCVDADVSLFRQIHADHPLIDPKCVWATREVMLSDTEALIFRSQDCTAAKAPADDFHWADGKLSMGAGPGAIAILDILPVPAGKTAKAVALDKLKLAPVKDQSRCMIRAVEDAPMGGVTFELSPNDGYMAALSQKGEVVDACGPYGLTNSVQFFEDRGQRALFHRLGQDTGSWDPASFTFYAKGADGKWVKSAE